MKKNSTYRVVLMLLIFCVMSVSAAHLQRDDVSVVEAASKKAVYKVTVNSMRVRAGKVTINGTWRKGATRKKAASKSAKKLGKGTRTFRLKKGCVYKMYDTDSRVTYKVGMKSYVNQVTALKMTVYVYTTKTGQVKKMVYMP